MCLSVYVDLTFTSIVIGIMQTVQGCELCKTRGRSFSDHLLPRGCHAGNTPLAKDWTLDGDFASIVDWQRKHFVNFWRRPGEEEEKSMHKCQASSEPHARSPPGAPFHLFQVLPRPQCTTMNNT